MNKQKLAEISEKVCKKAIAKLHSKKASIPEVGFFWIDMTGLMYAESATVNSVKPYGGFTSLEGSYCLIQAAISGVLNCPHASLNGTQVTTHGLDMC